MSERRRRKKPQRQGLYEMLKERRLRRKLVFKDKGRKKLNEDLKPAANKLVQLLQRNRDPKHGVGAASLVQVVSKPHPVRHLLSDVVVQLEEAVAGATESVKRLLLPPPEILLLDESLPNPLRKLMRMASRLPLAKEFGDPVEGGV